MLLKCFQDRNLSKANTSSSCTGWHCKKRTQNSWKKSHKQVDLCGPVNTVLPLPRTGSLVLWSAVIGPGSAWAAPSLSGLNRCPVIAYSVCLSSIAVSAAGERVDRSRQSLSDRQLLKTWGQGSSFHPFPGSRQKETGGDGKTSPKSEEEGIPTRNIARLQWMAWDVVGSLWHCPPQSLLKEVLKLKLSTLILGVSITTITAPGKGRQ